MATYVVIAHRYASSMFGASSSPVKKDGEIETFPTIEAARARADELKAKTTSPHVTYTASER